MSRVGFIVEELLCASSALIAAGKALNDPGIIRQGEMCESKAREVVGSMTEKEFDYRDVELGEYAEVFWFNNVISGRIYAAGATTFKVDMFGWVYVFANRTAFVRERTPTGVKICASELEEVYKAETM